MKKFIASICIVTATMSFANEGPCRGHDKKGECKPPKEAIEVCVGLASDAECKMTSPHGDLVTGKCVYTPDEKYFACKPPRREKQEK